MTFEDFKTLMEGAVEHQNLEFKGAMMWNIQTFIPTILAMSNLRDGGTIVVGVDNEPIKLRGLSNEQVASFEREQMMDKASGFGLPSPQFDVDTVSGPIEGVVRAFIVIRVKSFQVSPVICAKDSNRTERGAVYYRNSNGRPQSARVSSEIDMREIIEIAAYRQIQKWREIGLAPESIAPPLQEVRRSQYDSELGGMI